MNQFIEEVTNPFSYQEINKPRTPYVVGDLNLVQFKKLNREYPLTIFESLTDSQFINLPIELKSFTGQCLKYLTESQIPFVGRKFILELDNSSVIKGNSQRATGNIWHNDSINKEKPAIIFLACDCLPTEFMTTPPILNWPTKNFKSGEEKLYLEHGLQIETNDKISAKYNTIYLMNSYQVHRGVMSEETISSRTFLRLTLDTPERSDYLRFSGQSTLAQKLNLINTRYNFNYK